MEAAGYSVDNDGDAGAGMTGDAPSALGADGMW